MWESPINIIHENIKFEVENEVMKAVYKYGIDVDKNRLLEMLRGDSRSYDMGYATGKREVCERILKILEKYLIQVNEDIAVHGMFTDLGKRVALKKAIEIIRSEM